MVGFRGGRGLVLVAVTVEEVVVVEEDGSRGLTVEVVAPSTEAATPPGKGAGAAAADGDKARG